MTKRYCFGFLQYMEDFITAFEAHDKSVAATYQHSAVSAEKHRRNVQNLLRSVPAKNIDTQEFRASLEEFITRRVLEEKSLSANSARAYMNSLDHFCKFLLKKILVSKSIVKILMARVHYPLSILFRPFISDNQLT